MAKTYSEKLKDPRWQKKRLEIFERDKFKCRICNSGESTLHVHHTIYVTGNEPWECSDEFLVTLCENCHSKETDSLDDTLRMLKLLFQTLFSSEEIYKIKEGFRYIDKNQYPNKDLAEQIYKYLKRKK